MVSGVGFTSEASEEQKGAPRKRLVSRGLVVVFLALLLALGAWGGLKMWEKNIQAKISTIESNIQNTRIEMQEKLSDSKVTEFAMRAEHLQKELYRGHSTNDVLEEIEQIMVLNRNENDEPTNRVVLKSFEHNSGAYTEQLIGDTTVVLTGPGTITISADADNFDVMAQQIEKFKQSEYFDNVAVGTTDRDDFGRIVFTLTMDVKSVKSSPYEEYDGSMEFLDEESVEDEFVTDGATVEDDFFAADENQDNVTEDEDQMQEEDIE